jgi:polysaccharide pyruvyl transferase CsaB
MKIIHLISGGDVGGAKTHVLSLLRGLGQTEEVLLVCFMEGPFAQEARDLGIPIQVMDSGNILAVRKALVQLIRQRGFQVIHCHGARANLLGSLLRRQVGIPVVTTVHSDYRLDYLGRPLHRLTYGTINTVALRLLDYRIGVSDAMSELLISRGFDPQKIFSIYNGVDFSPVTPSMDRQTYLRTLGLEVTEDNVVFGIAARFNPVKDLPTLLRGFALAVKQCPNIRLVIAGDGEQAELLKKQAAETCPDGTVFFAGWVQDMDSFYNALDVNTLTSLSETFPYALTEGIRLHCATIASRVGGVPALIDHGVGGLLFEPGDYETLAAHLVTMATDHDFRHDSARRLYEKASEQFSFEATVRRQKEIYTTILRRQARPKQKRDGVLICGAYGKGNAGDDAILEAIIAQMRDIDPDMPLYVLSRTPAYTMQRYRIGACHTFHFWKFLPIMGKTKLYLSGGGSLVQDVTSSRSLHYYLTSIILAKRMGNKVLMYGCGIGPVDRPGNRRRTGSVINRYVDHICLRDARSAQELEELGVTKPPVTLAADPALILAPADPAKVDSHMMTCGMDPHGSYALFALRPWKGFEEKIPVFAEAAQYAYEHLGLTPVLFAVEPGRDLDAVQQVADRLTCPHHVLSSPEDGGLIIGLLSRMRVALSMRLHALIFAAASGVPLIGVVYDHKVSAFLDYLGQPLYTDLDKVTADTLKAQLDQAMVLYADTAARAEAVDRFRVLAQQSREVARALLEEK